MMVFIVIFFLLISLLRKYIPQNTSSKRYTIHQLEDAYLISCSHQSAKTRSCIFPSDWVGLGNHCCEYSVYMGLGRVAPWEMPLLVGSSVFAGQVSWMEMAYRNSRIFKYVPIINMAIKHIFFPFWGKLQSCWYPFQLISLVGWFWINWAMRLSTSYLPQPCCFQALFNRGK